MTAKNFMKKKPQEEEKKAPEASKFLKGAAVSPVLTKLLQAPKVHSNVTNKKSFLFKQSLRICL